MAAIRNLAFSRSLHRCVRRYYCCNHHDVSNTGDGTGSNSEDNSETRNRYYDDRKFSDKLPSEDVCLPFDGLSEIPNGVFRTTECEIIGPSAGKCNYYQNPEFYSYHNMSFFDMHLHLQPYRKPQIKTGRKP